jgi:hypothetical protein
MTDAARKHREGLRAVLRADVHERPDIWYVLGDGSNLDEVVADLLQVVLSTIPDLASLRDPCLTSARLKSGEFTNPESLHGSELIEAADAACDAGSG